MFMQIFIGVQVLENENKNGKINLFHFHTCGQNMKTIFCFHFYFMTWCKINAIIKPFLKTT